MRSPIVGRKIVARIPPTGQQEPLGAKRDGKVIEGPCQVVEYRGGWASFARDIELHGDSHLAGYRNAPPGVNGNPGSFSAACKRAERWPCPAAKMNVGVRWTEAISPVRWATWLSS